MLHRRVWLWSVMGCCAALVCAASGREATAGADPAVFQKSVDAAIAYCQTAQKPDGSYGTQKTPSVTAIITTGLLQLGKSPDDPLVAKSLKYIESYLQKDGGIYVPESNYKNYESALSIVCLKEANKDGRYDKLLKGADVYLKSLQWDEDEKADPSNFAYGGAGYGSKKRPDLSNTGFFMDALKATGNGPDDPAIKKALIFVSRCQNLESSDNTTPFAGKINDGGFYYTPAAGGASMANTDTDPPDALKSYGSMTYTGLKSMVYAGLKADDKRVKAATEWLKKNYTLKENPGMGQNGLYYYYLTISKALAAVGSDTFTDDKGVAHDWKKELVAELASQQKPDGSWSNEAKRWMEEDPILVTGYNLQVLGFCKPSGK